jgi:hypothetical protein
MLAANAMKAVDAVAGPLQAGQEGVVRAIDYQHDSYLIDQWWYDSEALVCRVQRKIDGSTPQTEKVPEPESEPEPELEPESAAPHPALFSKGSGIEGMQLTAAVGSAGVLATSDVAVLGNEDQQLQWTLRFKSTTLNRRFTVGVIEDEMVSVAAGDALSSVRLYRPGHAIRTDGVVGAYHMPELSLPTKDEDLRNIEIDVIAGRGSLRITKRTHGKPNSSGSSVGEEAALDSADSVDILSADVSGDGLLRLAVCAFPGCELELVNSVELAQRPPVLISCPTSCQHQLQPAVLAMSHLGVHYGLTADSDAVPCLRDQSQQEPTIISHPRAIVSYVARQHKLYPADARSCNQADVLLATIELCWQNIEWVVRTQGTARYVQNFVVESEQWKSEGGTSLSHAVVTVSHVALLVEQHTDSYIKSKRTVADYALLLLVAWHLRLNAAAAAVYTTLIGEYCAFRATCSAATLEVLQSSTLASAEDYIEGQKKQLIQEDFCCLRELVQHDASPMTATIQTVPLHTLPLIDPIHLAGEHRDKLTALLLQIFAAAVNIVGTEEATRSACGEMASVVHRLSYLYNIALDDECTPRVLAFNAMREALRLSVLPCAAREWFLRAFDLFHVGQKGMRCEHARRCLLDARICDLRATRATSTSLSKPFNFLDGTSRRNTALHALLYEPSYTGVEAEAWRLAFPTANIVVDHVLTDILQAATRRHELLEQERLQVTELQQGVKLTQTDSGSLLRVDSHDTIVSDQRVSVSDNISENCPRHILSPVGSVVPVHALSTLLNGLSTRCVHSTNACAEIDSKKERKVKHATRNGGPNFVLLKVVPQTNNDACGFHSFFNMIVVARALSSPSLLDALDWMKDLQSKSAFGAFFLSLQQALKREAKKRQQEDQATGSSSWEVASILERSHAVWLLRTDPRIAVLGGDNVFSVAEFAEEGLFKSFELSQTVNFHMRVLKEFAEAPSEASMLKVILLGTTEGKDSGHWVVLVAVRRPAMEPEFCLMDSQNKVSSKSIRHASELLVRCLRGEASLLQDVLTQRLAPFVTAVTEAAAGEGDTSLAKLRATKPAAAWKQDELASLETLVGSGGVAVEETQATQLREAIHALMRRMDWAHIATAPAGERESVAEMARVLAACGAFVGCETQLLKLPDVAKAKPDESIVQSLCEMGFSIFAAQRACLGTGNRSTEAALSWAIEHSMDANANDPLSDSESGSDPDEVSEGAGD